MKLRVNDLSLQDKIRLQVFLAHAGVASRRASEQIILDGRVTVNGEVVTELGTKVSSEDKITVDGKLVTNGGRVLNVCALASNLNELREKVYKASELITFEGKYCRKDIGLR